MRGLGATKSRLRNLLKYTDELLSFNEKVAFDLAREPYPHFHEFQIATLEGVEIALDEDMWLRIRRLRETLIRSSTVGSILACIPRPISRPSLSQSAFCIFRSRNYVLKFRKPG